MKSLPLVPTTRALERIAATNRQLLDSMASLLASNRESRGSLPRLLPTKDGKLACLLVAPILMATPETLPAVATRSFGRSNTCIALLRWPDGFFASLQLRYSLSESKSNSYQWKPVTLAASSSARVLLSIYRRSPRNRDLCLIAMAHLRFQGLALNHHDSRPVLLRVVDAGISSARSGARYRIATLASLLEKDEARLIAAHARAASIFQVVITKPNDHKAR